MELRPRHYLFHALGKKNTAKHTILHYVRGLSVLPEKHVQSRFKRKDMDGTSQVGYMPDSFGFIGQMPQLLLGFGIKSFVSGRFAKKGSSEGMWLGPDGSEVLYAFLGKWYCHAIDNGKLIQPSSASHAKSMLEALDTYLKSQGAKSVQASDGHVWL